MVVQMHAHAVCDMPLARERLTDAHNVQSEEVLGLMDNQLITSR